MDKSKISEEIKSEIVSQLRDEGFENCAAYVEKYGVEDLNPSYWKLASKEADKFYGVCLDLGVEWKDLVKFPENAIF